MRSSGSNTNFVQHEGDRPFYCTEQACLAFCSVDTLVCLDGAIKRTCK